jgi:cytochrome c
MTRIAFALLLLLVLTLCPAQAQLRGHGGPVRALAISADGKTAVSGSFDTSAIRWSLPRNAAEQVLRFHRSAVNAVALVSDGRIVTGGGDGKIAVWQPGETAPERIPEGHVGPVVSLAVSPDGATLASASWDRSIRLWPLADGGTPRVLGQHQQNVNGVAFTPDGKSLVSAAYDLTLHIWPLDGGTPIVVALPTPLNSVAVSGDGEIIAGAPTAGFSSFRAAASRAAKSTAARHRSSPLRCQATAR